MNVRDYQNLYNACMNYCKLFGTVMARQSQVKLEHLTDKDTDVELLKHNLERDKRWLKNEFRRLCEVVDELREVEMTEKRFTFEEINHETEPFRYSIMRDNLTSKQYDNSIKGLSDIVNLVNNLWEQTQRFEKHNKDLMGETEQLKQELYECEKDYILETYADNPIRGDKKIEELNKELQ